MLRKCYLCKDKYNYLKKTKKWNYFNENEELLYCESCYKEYRIDCLKIEANACDDLVESYNQEVLNCINIDTNNKEVEFYKDWAESDRNLISELLES